MSPTTRAKKIKLEEDKELSRINDLSQRLKNLEAFNEINDFTNQPDSLRRSVRLQYSLIRTIVDVKRPREQVADAEALLGLTNTVVESLQLRPNCSISPSIFISWLLQVYGLRKGRSKNAMEHFIIGKSLKTVNWEKIGADASLVFMEGKGCKTMLGVLKTEFKPTKQLVVYHSYPKEIVVYRRLPPRKVYLTRPKLVAGETVKDKPDVSKNMSNISELLKEKKSVMLDELFLMRNSFAHTVENLFALSFLVHDGQASISADETGSRFACKIANFTAAAIVAPSAVMSSWMATARLAGLSKLLISWHRDVSLSTRRAAAMILQPAFAKLRQNSSPIPG
uniref:Non-structural maintenance of chromosomes element 4 n=1 Tax=Solanum tuberosum TaxID=4113 RepID=M1D903_SOLTU